MEAINRPRTSSHPVTRWLAGACTGTSSLHLPSWLAYYCFLLHERAAQKIHPSSLLSQHSLANLREVQKILAMQKLDKEGKI